MVTLWGGSEVRGALRTPGTRAQVEQEAEERCKKEDTKLSFCCHCSPKFCFGPAMNQEGDDSFFLSFHFVFLRSGSRLIKLLSFVSALPLFFLIIRFGLDNISSGSKFKQYQSHLHKATSMRWRILLGLKKILTKISKHTHSLSFFRLLF